MNNATTAAGKTITIVTVKFQIERAGKLVDYRANWPIAQVASLDTVNRTVTHVDGSVASVEGYYFKNSPKGRDLFTKE